MLRCTTRCNFRCTYCFEKETTGLNEKLSLAKLEKIYNKVRDYLDHVDPDESINFEWTGGEPLLLGHEYFAKAFALQKKCFGKKYIKQISNAMQSNGSCINKKIIALLKKYNVGIGISWDLVGDDRQMRGKPINKLLVEKVKLLAKNELLFGLIIVVTNKNVRIMEEIYKSLRRMKIGFHFNYLNKTDTIFDEDIQPPMDVLVENSLKTIKRYYLDNLKKKKNIIVSNFSEDIKLAAENDISKASVCVYKADCSRGFVSIEPNGDCYPCPSFRASESFLGNILTDDFPSIFHNIFKDKLVERRNRLLKGDCKDCEWKRGCNGGCPAESYHTNGLFKKTKFSCEYRSRLLPRLKEFIKANPSNK